MRCSIPVFPHSCQIECYFNAIRLGALLVGRYDGNLFPLRRHPGEVSRNGWREGKSAEHSESCVGSRGTKVQFEVCGGDDSSGVVQYAAGASVPEDSKSKVPKL